MSNLQPLFYDFISNEYTSKNRGENGICAFQFIQDTAASSWSINHNLKFRLCKVNVFSDNELVIPDNVIVSSENTIIIRFEEPVSGIANILYYTSNAIECVPQEIVDTAIFAGINANPINSSDINGIEDIIV